MNRHVPTPPSDESDKPAPDAVAAYLIAARTAIDQAFGDGHAAANPTLVAAFLQACSIETAVRTGARASRETNATLLKLKPRIFG